MHLLPAAAAAVALIATPAAADSDAIGEILTEIDGVSGVWQTLRPEEDEAGRGTNYRDFGFVWQVGLLGRPADAPDDKGDRLAISFSGMDGEIEATEALIVLFDADSGRSFYSADANAGLVAVERLDLNTGKAFVEGRFAASLCFRDGLFSAPDPEDCREISGRFVTRLPLDES